MRIISLAPSNTEIVFALGEGSSLVGVTESCNYPSEAKLIDKIGGFSTPDIEKINSLSADLVLATDFHLKIPFISQVNPVRKSVCLPARQKRGIKPLPNNSFFSSKPAPFGQAFSNGVKNISIVKAKTILDVPEAILYVGSLIGREREAHKLAHDIKTQIETARDKIPAKRPKVCYLCSHNPLRIAREFCCVNRTIELAGGINIGKEIEQMDLDNIADKNPDVIIVSSGHGETVDLLNYVMNEPLLRKTNACKNNRVYRVKADLVSRFGPRAILGLKELAKFIHPA